MVTIYLRPITLRPILSDSLPFSTFAKATYSLLFILFPILEGFRQDCKKFIKFFSICQFKRKYTVSSIAYRVEKEKENKLRKNRKKTYVLWFYF